MEIWKNIKEFTNYEISNYGSVRNIKSGRVLKLYSKAGYNCCTLYENGKFYYFRVHRLVAFAFIDNIDNLPHVDHIDRNRQNNHVDNLRWINDRNNIRNTLVNKNLIYYNELTNKFMVQSSENTMTYPYNSLNDAIKHFNKLIGK
jgi:hypothetical protein